MKHSILDVVCSKADKEQTHASGVSIGSATFYVRLPAHLGLIAHTQWLPRLRNATIMKCNVTAYLVYEVGKEAIGGRTGGQLWPTTVHGVEQPLDSSELDRTQLNVYDPDSDMAKRIAQGVMDHSNQYIHKQTGIHDFTFVKNLPLEDMLPAYEVDKKTLQETETWKVYMLLKSEEPMIIWQGFLQLMAAGAGEVSRDGRWHPHQPPGSSYKLYRPELMAYDQKTGKYGGDEGHLDLFVGEMALTFETQVPLTYVDPADQREIQLNGVMAMAVSTQPQFAIRKCSTFHWASPEYEMTPTEYVIMKEQIDKLISNGMNQLAQQLGQMTQQPVIGTQPRATMPMTISTSDTVTIPSLIDLDAPQEQMYTQAIPLSEGSGPLANLQVDQKLAELKRGDKESLKPGLTLSGRTSPSSRRRWRV